MRQFYGKELYAWIDKIGKEKGFSDVTALCKASGASRGAVGNLNNGSSKSITMETAIKLCDTLGVSLDYLLTGEEKSAPAEIGKDAYRNDEILTAFKDAPDHVKAAIRTLLGLQ